MLSKYFMSVALVVAILTTLSSCKKSEDAAPAAPANGVNATINGVAFSSTMAYFVDSSSTAQVYGVSGTSAATSKSVQLTFPKATGTYSLSGLTSTASGTYTEGSAAWFASGVLGGSGTVTVTSYSSTGTAGTFSFTAKPFLGATGDKVITNGTFNIKK